jgi:amino acid adenylation domain-containing protein
VPLSPAAPAARLRAMLDVATPDVFIVDACGGDARARLAEVAPAAPIIALDASGRSDERDTAPDEHDAGGAAHWQPDDLAYIYFTSGSTGHPKGIAGRMKGVDHFVRWEARALGLADGVRVSQVAAPIFDAFLRDVFLPLTLGGTICAPPRRLLLDTPAFVAWLEASRVEVVHCVPSLFRTLVNHPMTRDRLADLRVILMAGEPLLATDVRRWHDTFGDRITIVNLYGQSETTMAKFAHVVTAEDLSRKTIPLGRPIEGTEAWLLDRRGQPCPSGMIGEIYVRTPYGSLGYYNRPDLTREVFVPRPGSHDPDDILYRTGDLARQSDDGTFEFLGRRDQQVKVRGIRVELAEVEAPLRACDGVRDVAVVDREDSLGHTVLCAYVVLDQGVTPRHLREQLAASLPDYLVPAIFVTLASLPRTLTGKVDRRALPPPPAEGEGGAGSQPPRNPIEEIVAGIVASALGLERIGVHDDFFRSGGHSLLATAVIGRIRAALRTEVPLRQLFESPTVAGLAAKIASQGDPDAATPIPRGGDNGEPLPLAYPQQRLWFLHRLAPDASSYNLSTALHVSGEFDARAAARSLDTIVARHEALRTRLIEIDGEPLQQAEPHRPWRLPVVDLQALSTDDRERAVARLGHEQSARPFDLGRAPLMRALLLRAAPRQAVLFVSLHHIVADGWAIGVLLREFAHAYEAYRAGRPVTLPPLPIQYADYTRWQLARMRDGRLDAELAYWERQLAGLRDVDLPTDFPRPAVRSWRGATEPVWLPQALALRLRALGRTEGATLFMVLAACLDVLLYKYTGQDDLAIGTPVANRQRPELEPLIGYLGNMLVLRTRVDGSQGFRSLLAHVRDTALDAYTHQDAPLDRLVDVLRPQRDASRNPLFQIVLTLQNAHHERLELPDLSARLTSYGGVSAKFDWLLVLQEGDEGLAGYLEYDTDLFVAPTIRRMWAHFEQVVEAVTADPLAPIDALDIWTADERRALAVNTTVPDLDEPLAL